MVMSQDIQIIIPFPGSDDSVVFFVFYFLLVLTFFRFALGLWDKVKL